MTEPKPLSKSPVTDERRRSAALWWVIGVALGAELITVGLYYSFYNATGASQNLLAAGLSGLMLLVTLAAGWQARNGRRDLAGALLLLGFAVLYGGGWLMEGITWPLVLTGLPAILLVGVVLIPGRWPLILASLALFGLNVAASTRYSIGPRFALLEDAPFDPLVAFGLVVALVAVFVLWHLVRAFRYGPIRLRLLLTSIILTTLLATAITATSAVISFQSGRQNAVQRLNLVAGLQEIAVNGWTEGLKTTLNDVFPGQEAIRAADTLITVGPEAADYEQARERLIARFTSTMEQSDLFDELSLLDAAGKVILSTTPGEEGRSRRYRTYYLEGLKGPYVQSPFFLTNASEGIMSVVASRPVRNEAGELIGVLAGRARVETLRNLLVEQGKAAEGVESFLLGASHSVFVQTGERTTLQLAESEGANRALEDKASGAMAYTSHTGMQVLGAFRWLPGLGAGLVVEQAQETAFSAATATLVINVAVGAGGAVLAALAALAITRGITGPLDSLGETVGRIAAGNLDLVAPVRREDEIGALARAFNSMTQQLKALISGLEKRVADRTADLEQRSRYLEAAAQVGQAATSILDTNQLMREVVELIRQRFDLYYVGLFLLDSSGKWAELSAGTGEAGRAMMARRHRIRVGEGMIGWSITHGQARIALEAGADAVRMATAELPHTRSEAAIPLRARGQVIGALTVQDRRPGAFDQDIIAVLQTMADQVAVALDNAQLFAERELAIQAQSRAYGELSRQDWLNLARGRQNWGYRFSRQTIAPVQPKWQPELARAAQTGEMVTGGADSAVVAVPLRVRDHTIGALQFKKAAGESWSEDEIGLVQALTEQLGITLEGARLYHETQQRAARERMTREIAARLRESLDMKTVLQTAAHEIGQTLDLAALDIRLGLDYEPAPAEEGNGYE